MSEENDNQPPLRTDTPADRPRRPRRRFPRRHDGPRDRGPQEQRGDLNGPADRAEDLSDGKGGAATTTQGEEHSQSSGSEQSPRTDGVASANGELEREPELGDVIIEISGKGFGFLRDAKRNFVQTPNDIFVTPEIVRRFGLRDGMWIYGETRLGNRGPQLI